MERVALRRTTAIACAEVGFVAVLPLAASSDQKTAPATACAYLHPWLQSASALDRPTFNANGGVSNSDSSDTQEIRCPLHRDDVTGKPTGVEVYYYDGHATQAIECRVLHHKGFGSISWSSMVSSSANYGTLSPSLPSTEVDYAFYTIECHLPPDTGTSSWVYGYWWEE